MTSDPTQWLDYVSTMGRELCQAINPDVLYDFVPMDASGAFIDFLGEQGASSAALQALTPASVAKIASYMSSDLGVPVSVEQVNTAIARLLWHWPAKP
jgi:hypothetical protein